MSIQIFATVTGQKQKLFKGESTQKGFEQKIPGVGLSFGVTVPYDEASGHSSGRRKHQPIVFTKEWGASSPQFYSAAYTNEVLTSVIFEVHKTSPAGVQQVDHTIKLTNARLSEVRDSLSLGQAGGPPLDSRDLQQIALTFEKIEVDFAQDTEVAISVATQIDIIPNKPFVFRTRGSA